MTDTLAGVFRIIFHNNICSALIMSNLDTAIYEAAPPLPRLARAFPRVQSTCCPTCPIYVPRIYTLLCAGSRATVKV